MLGRDLVIRTKLIPPRPSRHLLERPRLSRRLDGLWDRPLTIIMAGPGYGKSTALAHYFAVRRSQTFWYGVSEADAEPLLFAAHLVSAIAPKTAERFLALSDTGARNPDDFLEGAIDAALNEIAAGVTEEAALVVDDFHLAAGRESVLQLVEHFIEHLPPNLHLILSTREMPRFRGLARWRVKSQLLLIGQDELAFSPDEIAALYRHKYGYRLSAEQVSYLSVLTEGWIIALEMIWHDLAAGGSLENMWARLPGSLEPLFEYLAQEVLEKQSPPLADFLVRTAVLATLDDESCDEITGRADSSAMLRQLKEKALFLIDAGEGTYRYHHLFHGFLKRRAQGDRSLWRELNRRAAELYAKNGDVGEAVPRFLEAGEGERAAEVLVRMADNILNMGRIDGLWRWIESLPPEILERYPALVAYGGDVLRLTSRYDEALEWYGRARELYEGAGDRLGMSRAVEGSARVYLDTVQPSRAGQLLKEAVRLLGKDGDQARKARLLKLLAENETNRGQLAVAEKLERVAQKLLRDGASGLDVRIYLRTGRLETALRLLERRLQEENALSDGQKPHRIPQSHRETYMLLSLIYSFMGRAEEAVYAAKKGIEVGRALGSPFVEVVGYMRLGHALQIAGSDRDRARSPAHYRQAIALADKIGVERGKAEPLMGLCLYHGLEGESAVAEKHGREALAILERSGDEWLAGMVRLALGIAAVTAGEVEKARDCLDAAARAFVTSGDSYLLAATNLWASILALRTGSGDEFRERSTSLLQAAQANGYDYLFSRMTLFGPRDRGLLAPVLLEARRLGIRSEYASWLMGEMGIPRVDFHPGYSLRVQMLGPFRVWRGQEEISSKEWQRGKAKQLFQVLLLYRREFLQKERILEMLWPELDPDTATRDFKVALNALNDALEPGRSARGAPFYILRHESSYGINLAAGIWLDVDEFESLVARAVQLEEKAPGRSGTTGDAGATDAEEQAIGLYRDALELYRGDFLQDSLYEDWASEERERLQVTYLRAAESLAGMLARRGEYDDAIQLCYRILNKDSCWEEAYRLLMYCYHRQGNRVMALRTYEKCVERLHKEMDVSPMPKTVRLHAQIAAGDAAIEY